jgi:hypothetical protein
MQYFSDDDFAPRSPPLRRVQPRVTPSPSPPPVITKSYPPIVSYPWSSRRQRMANRRKTRPTQGDWVLIREMAPNQPEIAQQVSQQALNSDSSDSGHEDDDIEDPWPIDFDTATATSPRVFDPSVYTNSTPQSQPATPHTAERHYSTATTHSQSPYKTREKHNPLYRVSKHSLERSSFDSHRRTIASEPKSTRKTVKYTISKDATNTDASKSIFVALKGRAKQKPQGAHVGRGAHAQNLPDVQSKHEWKGPRPESSVASTSDSKLWATRP